MRGIFCVLAAVATFQSFGAAAQSAAEPLYVPIAEFGTFGADNASSAAMMTPEEAARFETAIADMQDFAHYLYSGCHDRAHAAYLLLPADLKAKVSKIWVIGSSRYTAALSGTIRLRADDPDSQAVDWGYHVALSAETAAGTRIFDPALHPGATLSREQWFAKFIAPRLSIWLVSSPAVYQFNYATLDGSARNGTQVWNGNANRYEWLDTKMKRLPENLARDAIGVDALAGKTCKPIIAVKTDPQKLSDFLAAGDGGSECASSVKKYAGLVAEWKRRLSL